MGTRYLIRFKEAGRKDIVRLYGMYDGYIERIGRLLAHRLQDFSVAKNLTDGVGMGKASLLGDAPLLPDRYHAYDIDYLSDIIRTEFNDSVGRIHTLSESDDPGADYVYDISVSDEVFRDGYRIHICCWDDWGGIYYNGPVDRYFDYRTLTF